MNSVNKSVELDESLARLRGHLNQVLVGQAAVVEQLLVCLLAGGHALVEGVPGLGKTRLVKALAGACGGSFNRLQFTPDLMPSDIVGHAMFNAANSEFSLRKGPIFANFIVADEINRAPAKTQSALLEAMEESQVSLEGSTLELPQPFLVLATQNPVDHDGTYPLPQAQFDRFLMKIEIDYPALEDEIEIVTGASQPRQHSALLERAVLSLEQVQALQQHVLGIHVDRELVAYAVRLVASTRDAVGLDYGAGPRASMALIAAGRGRACLEGRDHLLPDDIKAVANSVLRHRIALSAELEIQGLTVERQLLELMESVEAPRQ